MRRHILWVVGIAVCLLTAPAWAVGITITVNDAADAGDADGLDGICARVSGQASTCTLRAALDVAGNDDKIEIDAAITQIVLDTMLGVGSDVKITSKAPGRTVIDGRNIPAMSTAIIYVKALTVTFENLEIANGKTTGIDGANGGSSCLMAIKNCDIHDNTSPNDGAGIRTTCPLALSDSIVANNVAGGSGGGINVSSYATLTIDRSAITGNQAKILGGGINISNTPSGSIPHRISDSLIAGNVVAGGNSLGRGGGLAWSGSNSILSLSNVTFTKNSASNAITSAVVPSYGGAVYISPPGPATLNNVTMTDNSAAASASMANVGGGIAIMGSATPTAPPTIQVGNTIIARNRGVDDCFVSSPTAALLVSRGYNLVGTMCPHTTTGDQLVSDPTTIGVASALADNGGPTQTLALLRGGPAIDTGSPGGPNDLACEDHDQRGVPRPLDGNQVGGSPRCDIGAYEFKPSTDVKLDKTSSPAPVVGKPMIYTLTVTNAGPDVARAVSVDDDLPSTLTDASVSPSQGSCTIAGQLVHCVLGDLAAGATATVLITATPSTAGELSNTGDVSHQTHELNPGDNRATNTTTVAPAPVTPQDTTVSANEVSNFSGSGLVRGRACSAAGGEGSLAGLLLMLAWRRASRRLRRA